MGTTITITITIIMFFSTWLFPICVRALTVPLSVFDLRSKFELHLLVCVTLMATQKTCRKQPLQLPGPFPQLPRGCGTGSNPHPSSTQTPPSNPPHIKTVPLCRTMDVSLISFGGKFGSFLVGSSWVKNSTWSVYPGPAWPSAIVSPSARPPATIMPDTLSEMN